MAPEQKRRKFVTLNDLDPYPLNNNNKKKEYQSHERDIQIAHIPTLSNADQAKRLLERIYKEFLPILQKRGYAVSSVSELCCCGDGLDRNNNKNKKTRRMNANVLGYNQTTLLARGTKKSHTIHLRLRHPHNHTTFYNYESIAGTMAHELAHCEIGPHNGTFYQLMDEIQQQHAVYLTKGIVADNQGFPIHSQQAYVLGRGGGRSTNSSTSSSSSSTNTSITNTARHAAAKAAQQRRQRLLLPCGPQRLGGGQTFLGDVAQAAALAAESRRAADELWCVPCAPQTMELSNDDDDSDDDDSDAKLQPQSTTARKEEEGRGDTDGEEDRKMPAAASVQCSGATRDNDTTKKTDDCRKPSPSCIVDLTADGSDDDNDNDNENTHPPELPHRPAKHRRTNRGVSNAQWQCAHCTYLNPSATLACGVCGTALRHETDSLRMAQQLQHTEWSQAEKRQLVQSRRDRAIAIVKDGEVRQSIRDFGFNVYGTEKQKTSTLKHLT